MNDPASISVNAESVKLRAAIDGFSAEGFAVLDGAQFEDLPALLRREGLFARSLFLDHADREIEAAGPWLVGLDQTPDALDRIFALVGERPAAVYWSCPADELVLHRHLRTLNIARIPSWAADERPAPTETERNEPSTSVTFRHWDPRVLGAFLPVLDAAQFARILAPASEIAFLASEFGGVRRVVRDPGWPPARPGVLTVSTAQMLALNERRLSASHRRIASYLRKVAADDVCDASDEALLRHVAISVAAGRQLKLSSEAAHCRWAYLMLATRGQIAGSADVARYISQGGADPDEQVSLVLKSTIIALQKQRAQLDAGR